MAYPERFREDFDRMEKEYIQSLEERERKRSKSFFYVAVAVIALATIVVAILASYIGQGDSTRKHNVTEISWSPVLPNLTSRKRSPKSPWLQKVVERAGIQLRATAICVALDTHLANFSN